VAESLGFRLMAVSPVIELEGCLLAINGVAPNG
jgi:hypothetical protein